MDNDQLKILLRKYRLGECTEEEVQLVESWYNAESAIKSDKVSMAHLSQANANIWGKVIANVDLPNAMPVKEEDNVVGVKKVGVKEDNAIAVKLSKIDESKMGSTRLWLRILRITGIAAAVAAITLGVWFFSAQYLNGRHPEFISGSPLVNDIKPGKNTATIILANGKTINLSDAKTGVVIGNDLTYNDGTAVANLSPSGRDGVTRDGNNNNNPLSPQGGSLPEGERSRVQTLTASTPRGGTYQVILPDGTRVWLNADSRISFPSQFVGEKREVLLTGEAYFEVAKNKKMPFMVESEGQQVEVLGTHFNINAYKGDVIKTTLLEGSVRVAFVPFSPQGRSLPGGDRNVVVLKPNQQSITGSNRLIVRDVNVDETIAWKNGRFAYSSTRLDEVMKQIERWYNVEVIYEDPELKSKTLSGTVSRYDNVSRILKTIENTGRAHFKIDGRKVIVSR